MEDAGDGLRARHHLGRALPGPARQGRSGAAPRAVAALGRICRWARGQRPVNRDPGAASDGRTGPATPLRRPRSRGARDFLQAATCAGVCPVRADGRRRPPRPVRAGVGARRQGQPLRETCARVGAPDAWRPRQSWPRYRRARGPRARARPASTLRHHRKRERAHDGRGAGNRAGVGDRAPEGLGPRRDLLRRLVGAPPNCAPLRSMRASMSSSRVHRPRLSAQTAARHDAGERREDGERHATAQRQDARRGHLDTGRVRTRSAGSRQNGPRGRSPARGWTRWRRVAAQVVAIPARRCTCPSGPG